MNDPSMAEMLRRLEEVTKSVEKMASTLEQSYVRRDVYEAKHLALLAHVDAQDKEHGDDIKEIRKTGESEKAFRRQIVAGVSVGFILVLANLLFNIQTILGSAQ